jgi:hypothetical protein
LIHLPCSVSLLYFFCCFYAAFKEQNVFLGTIKVGQ